MSGIHGSVAHVLGRLAVAVGVAGLMMVLAACGGASQPDPSSPSTPTAAAPAVGRDTSPNPGSVNAYWLTTPSGVIVVDSSRNRAGGRRVAAAVRATGQPVLGILITHSHPDHVGGLGELHAAFPDTPMYASSATIAEIRTDR